MTSELETAIAAARAAGRLLCERLGTSYQVRHKGPADLVTDIDRQAQDMIASLLLEAFPSYGLLGEEGGNAHFSDGPRWIVDPLDGTVNYIRGYPFFAVSIALERDGDLVLGVVYNPTLEELFVAQKGQGATLNGDPIHVSGVTCLEESVLASGFPYQVWTSDDDNSREWRRFLKRALSMRCDASASIDLCHVAMGRLDGHWEQELGPWDMAAGALMVQEAGGSVTQVTGEPFSPYGRGILASNGHLHAAMLAVLGEG
ncbi:MAG: inositol monophosphatase family protein [Anaerolineae bacterium]